MFHLDYATFVIAVSLLVSGICCFVVFTYDLFAMIGGNKKIMPPSPLVILAGLVLMYGSLSILLPPNEFEQAQIGPHLSVGENHA